MKMAFFRAAIASALFVSVAVAQEIETPETEAQADVTAASALNQIIDDHWAWTMEEYPTFATSLGVRDYDDRLSDPSLEAEAKREAKTAEFIARLEAIDVDQLTEAFERWVVEHVVQDLDPL